MTHDEYNKLFHDLQLNLVAFKLLIECDQEILKLVNAAIEAEREACAKVCDELADEAAKAQDFHAIDACESCGEAIRSRSDE